MLIAPDLNGDNIRASHSSKPEQGVLWHSWWLVGYSETIVSLSPAKFLENEVPNNCGFLKFQTDLTDQLY